MTGRQKTVSHRGKGKWQTWRSLDRYRRRRNTANETAHQSRKRNR